MLSEARTFKRAKAVANKKIVDMHPKDALCIKRRFAYFGREVAGEREEDVNEKDDGLETNAQPAPRLHLGQHLSVRIEGEKVLEVIF